MNQRIRWLRTLVKVENRGVLEITGVSSESLQRNLRNALRVLRNEELVYLGDSESVVLTHAVDDVKGIEAETWSVIDRRYSNDCRCWTITVFSAYEWSRQNNSSEVVWNIGYNLGMGPNAGDDYDDLLGTDDGTFADVPGLFKVFMRELNNQLYENALNCFASMAPIHISDREYNWHDRKVVGSEEWPEDIIATYADVAKESDEGG